MGCGTSTPNAVKPIDAYAASAAQQRKGFASHSSRSLTLLVSGGQDSTKEVGKSSAVNTFIMGAASEMNGCPLEKFPCGAALLIIDPQNDFHPPAGSLGVPGAVQDTQRTIAFLQEHSKDIGEVIVTLDTHHKMHIAHAAFWAGNDGQQPAPFTIVEAMDIKAGKWRATQPEMEQWSLEYAEKLEAGGRFKICIWPDHCLMGTHGHAVYQPLADALNVWAEKHSRSITWVLKGQNNSTEMYSALKAEVEVSDDPATQLNHDLINRLTSFHKVFCCGQAKSHCVNYTVRDLVGAWPPCRVQDIVVLTDACSSVPGFEEAGCRFEADMRSVGVTCCATIDVALLPSADINHMGSLPLQSSSDTALLTTSKLASGAALVLNGNGLPQSTCSKSGISLVIIDPQNDFHPPHGALAVPGAVEDSEHIIGFLEKHAMSIDRVVVTLDTHHKMHIAHAGFWVGRSGQKPAPFTIIESADIMAGTWRAKQPEMEHWSIEYAQKLEAQGRFKICIWPDHCLMGTPGHAVYPPLAAALNAWAQKRTRSVTWVLKGQNNRTEMYSAFKAEVELPDDPSTELNTSLLSELQSSSTVVFCGQAKSHCVNYSVRDLVSFWPKDRLGDVIVLGDACSSVPGFEEAGLLFESDMIKAGVRFHKSTHIGGATRLLEKMRIDMDQMQPTDKQQVFEM